MTIFRKISLLFQNNNDERVTALAFRRNSMLFMNNNDVERVITSREKNVTDVVTNNAVVSDDELACKQDE